MARASARPSEKTHEPNRRVADRGDAPFASRVHAVRSGRV